MNMHASQLRERDVINICTGKRLGYICDFLIDCDCGKISAVLVSEHYFSLGNGKNTICIPWDKICCIGTDAVLVRIEQGDCIAEGTCQEPEKKREEKRRRENWFFG